MSKLTCPVCNGTGQVLLTEKERTYHWNKDKTHRHCTNCGGQYMFGQGTGKVSARPDGTACVHDYEHTPGKWRCTHNYTCKHCGDHYMIDSGD